MLNPPNPCDCDISLCQTHLHQQDRERKAFDAMREALRDLLIDAENDHIFPCGREVCDYCERIDKARAALAKATGRE